MSDSLVPYSGHLILVHDTEAVASAVRISCPPSFDLNPFVMTDLLTEHQAFSEEGRDMIEQSDAADAVLFEWQLQHASLLNNLSYRLRERGRIPTVALVGGSQEDATGALASGADALLTFPIFFPLLQAQIAAYRRIARTAPRSAPADWDEQAAVKAYGPLHIDSTTHRFYVREREVDLTLKEYDLITYLIAHPGRLCTRHELLAHVWGIDFDTGTNMVDVYVHFVRRKLEALGLKDAIETVRGLGYRLVLPDTEGFRKSQSMGGRQ